MHDDDLTPMEKKVEEAKAFLESLKAIDIEAHDQLLRDRFNDALDKTAKEYPEARGSYSKFLKTNAEDMSIPELTKLHGLAAMFVAALEIGRIKVKKPDECAETGNFIADWCREMIEGTGGMNDYEYYEAVDWGVSDRVAAAEWILRCLANPANQTGAIILEKILLARHLKEEEGKTESSKQSQDSEESENTSTFLDGLFGNNDEDEDSQDFEEGNS
jgi:hypothetical protein